MYGLVILYLGRDPKEYLFYASTERKKMLVTLFVNNQAQMLSFENQMQMSTFYKIPLNENW